MQWSELSFVASFRLHLFQALSHMEAEEIVQIANSTYKEFGVSMLKGIDSILSDCI